MLSRSCCRSPFFVHPVFLLIILMIIPALSFGDEHSLLLLIDVEEKKSATYWWANRDKELTQMDRKLMVLLNDNGFRVTDPSGPNTPKLSKVYHRKNLTLNNSLNIATLFGAEMVLRGTLVFSEQKENDRLWPQIMRIDAEFQGVLLDSNNGVELLELRFRRSSFGQNNKTLIKNLERELSNDLGQMISQGTTLITNDTGIVEKGPYLMLSGIQTMDSVNEFFSTLENSGFNVKLNWFSDGLIGLKIDPGHDSGELWVHESANILLSEPPLGINLDLSEQGDQGVLLKVSPALEH